MHEIKQIKTESIPRAIAKAERYRLLNEPRSAESICRDVLAVDPEHEGAIKILILAVTDQFGFRQRQGMQERKEEVEGLLTRLSDTYSQRYYNGVMFERWAKGLLAVESGPHTVYEFLSKAMLEYDAAAKLAARDNQDAVLRWNTCVRLIARYGLKSQSTPHGTHIESFDPESFDDEVPYR